MCRQLPWTVTISGFAMVLCIINGAVAAAQEARDGGGQQSADELPALIAPSSAQEEQARGLGRTSSEPVAEETRTDDPKESVMFTLWVLSLTNSNQLPADELRDKLTDKISNLPAVVGSIRDVRELIGKLQVAGLLRSAREFRLNALDGGSVSMQMGRNQPRVIATNVDPHAGRTNSLQLEPVGTIIELRPQIGSQLNIRVSVKFSQSEIEKSTDVIMAEPIEGTALYADVVTTRQLEATTSLKNDTAVLLQSAAATASKDGASNVELELMILGAAIVPARL
jgi:hypothetical protein